MIRLGITIQRIFNDLIGRKALAFLIVSLFASLFLGLAEYGIALVLQVLLVVIGLLDRAIVDSRVQFLLDLPTEVVFIVLLVIGLVRFACGYTVGQSNVIFSESVALRLRLLTSYQVLKTANLLEASEVHTRFSDIFPKTAAFVISCARSSGQLVITFSLLIYMLLTLTLEAGISLCLVGLLGIVILRQNKAVQKIARNLPSRWKSLVSTVDNISKNNFYIKISGMKDKEYEQLSGAIIDYSSLHLKTNHKIHLSTNLPQLYSVITVSVIIYISLNVIGSQGTALLSFLYILMRFTQSLSPLASHLGGCVVSYPQFKISLNMITGISNSEHQELQNANHFWRNKKKPVSINQVSDVGHTEPPHIAIKKLSLSWVNTSQPLFADFSHDIEPGAMLGVVGESGSGKSSLMQAILGMMPISQGEVLFAQKFNPAEYTERFSSSIGYVGPNPFLIDGSIYENLMYGNFREVSHRDIDQLLRQVGLKEFSERGAKGLGFKINAKQTPSTGQQQRLALIRALLRDPKLLILDEATANLDAETELVIKNLIEDLKGTCTIIAISHKLDFLSISDSILKIENSTITKIR